MDIEGPIARWTLGSFKNIREPKTNGVPETYPEISQTGSRTSVAVPKFPSAPNRARVVEPGLLVMVVCLGRGAGQTGSG